MNRNSMAGETETQPLPPNSKDKHTRKEERMKLSKQSPWYEYYSQITALFGQDPEIEIIYDEEAQEIKLHVDNAVKADALTQLLPAEKEWGGVKLKITVVPSNDPESMVSLFQKAFDGNPAFSYTEHVDNAGFTADYIVFAHEVVQYFDDNIGDVNGNKSTLYEAIAREVFDVPAGTFFCTDTEDGIEVLFKD